LRKLEFLLPIFLLSLAFCSHLRAEDKPGTAAQLKREVSLRKEPSESSPSLGRLPKGTILTLQGQEKDGFIAVDVELEEGSIEGWLPKDAVSKVGGEDEASVAKKKKVEDDDDESEEEAPPPIVKPKRKVKIPKDEGLLLRRDPVFFYGIQAGLGESFLHDNQGNLFTGLALNAGGQVGFYIDRGFTARIEVSYEQLNGSADPNINVQYAFIDMAAIGGYWLDDFELFAGFQYAYGISLTDIPGGGKVDGASDLSNLGVVGGAGYRFHIGELTDLVVRAKYFYSFLSAPLNFQAGTLSVALIFRG
jgi:hypothetical protein